MDAAELPQDQQHLDEAMNGVVELSSSIVEDSFVEDGNKKNINCQRPMLNDELEDRTYVELEVVVAEGKVNDHLATQAIMVNNSRNAQILLLKKNSPIRNLHDLVSHNISVKDGIRLINDSQTVVSEDKEEMIQENLYQVARSADVSPISVAREEKREGNKEQQKFNYIRG
ncbi:hypothetical protein K7X08_002724 [Anisodus acutangulus]|uniref:Uncharacterized protein n=1 Tax=Anisodus acutangulus TaxID=402998 RepID=A0A9Q1RHK3_9SOLA|nr:hypothetical protein K7X08_002724 [Anisodus acutangulus]